MAKGTPRKRKRRKLGVRARWYNAPQGKQIKLANGSVIMRIGGDIVELPQAYSVELSEKQLTDSPPHG